MENCPSLQEWLDLADNRTTEARAVQLRAHLETGCRSCQTQQAWVGRTLAALVAVKAPGLAESTRLALRKLAAERLVTRERPLWIATLLRDTRRQQALGARGGDEGIQLRYEAGDFEVRLWAEPAQTTAWYLIGQVYDRASSQFVTPDAVALLIAQEPPKAARLEDTEFHLSALEAGTYQLAIRLAETELLIPTLTLEAV